MWEAFLTTVEIESSRGCRLDVLGLLFAGATLAAMFGEPVTTAAGAGISIAGVAFATVASEVAGTMSVLGWLFVLGSAPGRPISS